MKKTIKRLPVILAVACTLFAASCSDIAIEPVNTEDDDGPIVIPPPPPKPAAQTSASIDSVLIG